MTDDLSARIAELHRHETDLVFASFDHTDAWLLGSSIVETARAAGYPIAVDIRRPGLILFRAALPGAVGDQEEWIRRTSASAFRFDSSTARLSAEFSARGGDATLAGSLNPADYSMSGGAFPVRVTGTGVVAVVTVSGLASDDDHQLVVDAMANYLEARSRARDDI